MPSLVSRLYRSYSRLVIRRRRWGATPEALARRARRVFHLPEPLRRLGAPGARITPVAEPSGVRGEWVDAVGADPHAGVLLYVHGGGYVAGEAADRRPIAAALARVAGCRVFSTDYRLAPEAPFPAALEDVIAVYRWLLTAGAPGAPVALAGDSAGGGLVLLLAQHARLAGLAPPACVAALSPWTDLAGGGASVHENAGRDDMFHPSTIHDCAAAYLAGAAPSDPCASPLHGEAHGLPPVLLHVGDTELLLDDARAMHVRLLAAGGTSRLEVYEGVAHAWHLLVPVMPEAVRAVDDVAGFVRAHLGAARAWSAA
jgi:acetyl esterase/lipase